jgi:hypothetical protein
LLVTPSSGLINSEKGKKEAPGARSSGKRKKPSNHKFQSGSQISHTTNDDEEEKSHFLTITHS